MILFFEKEQTIYVVDSSTTFGSQDLDKLSWLFSEAKALDAKSLNGTYIGPRREMITPWSTNAVEITQNMGLKGIKRIEEFKRAENETSPYDKLTSRMYNGIGQDIFKIEKQPEPIIFIDDIETYNRTESLALNKDEVNYLNRVVERVGRKLTDSEVFGFSQVNSEHCRHKIFNGQLVIDGKTMPESLFGMIRKTTSENPNRVVSAYTDNCAFIKGPVCEQFAPTRHDTSDFFSTKDFESVISIKAETHNFPTTVEPFNGAATGTGGEIRDRMAGGKGAFPMAGTAIYMTSYPRLESGKAWENGMAERQWLYHNPSDILIKASNGASDFGNKFGQPVICGSLQTFEHQENGKKFGYDKVIMFAGGIGYGKRVDCLKDEPVKGEKVVILGGDNYRIGMGGAAVSSVETGEFDNSIELNAIQRSNPEMQKRVYNAIRAISEEDNNPIVSIHDHGAGGHLNCLSELIEATGGCIDMEKLPVGDHTLSDKEIIGNESQERMGLVIKEHDIDRLTKIAERERAPIYVVGETTGDMLFTFKNNTTGKNPIDIKLECLFGKPPRTVLTDVTVKESYKAGKYSDSEVNSYIENVLQIEAVACKDWLTNKVDRSVTGRIAQQQCVGEIQVPLADCGVLALDYQGTRGMATALGHAPVAAMIDAAKGSQIAIAESLTNIVLTPIEGALTGVSLSANWMWPCKNQGEDARLYSAVKAASDFALALGINIPTGKDSLSMTQKYPSGEQVYSPGTVIVTAAAEVTDIRKVVNPALKHIDSQIVYVDFSRDSFGVGASSFAQTLGKIGGDVPTITDPKYFAKTFNAIQQLVDKGVILAGHDISAGGLITALLEMTFTSKSLGVNAILDTLKEKDLIKVLFSEKPAILLQVADAENVIKSLTAQGVDAYKIADVTKNNEFTITLSGKKLSLDKNNLRRIWFKTSYLLDCRQSGTINATKRYENFDKQKLEYIFPKGFTGKLSQWALDAKRKGRSGINAAIIREKGSNGDREMAWAMHLAGMDVKDVHMTDLISGREDLKDINLIVFVGGFSNSDVLNSAKGWAGAFLYNDRAKQALDNFFKRPDTLSLGVCNGCQLMIELGLITPDHDKKPRMLHNESHKFESNFVTVDIKPNKAVMLESLAGSRLGLWIAHGEGKFSLPYPESRYNIPMTYGYAEYPGNPNGSDYNAAAICSNDGRHMAIMPHPERAMHPWNCAYYPEDRRNDEVTPWIELFVNAKNWIKKHSK